MDQEIRFCTRPDGVRIAYAIIGDGPPLVYVRPVFGHLELEWERPEIRDYFSALARHHMVIRWDTHGTGLSDRERTQFTLDGQVAELESVVDLLDVDRFDLIGDASGGPAAIAFAAERPDRVHRLVLYGTFAYGSAVGPPEVLEAMTSLIRANWGLGSKTFADLIVPDVDTETVAQAAKLLRASVDGETAARLYELAWTTDVRDHLPRIRARTLVLHRHGERTVPFALGRDLAAQIAYARFLPLEGRSNLPYIGDAGAVLRAIAEFLGDPPPVSVRRAPVTIVAVDLEESVGLTQSVGDVRVQAMRRARDDVLRGALAAFDGRELSVAGDGTMAAFASPSSAIECAVRLQQELTSWAEANAETAMRVRVGIGAGELVADSEDVVGTPHQLAGRVCAEAAPGEILVADVVRQLVGTTRFAFADRGPTELKGFPEPTRIHAVKWE
jgi:class 3 adenylate cyclase/pimeloyl-ACP methyl ester carboxylesterase